MAVSRTVAVFDFDGTITRRDSTLAFCLAAVPRPRLLLGTARVSPQLAAYRFRLLPNWAVKEAVLRAFFAGAAEEALRARAAAWAVRDLPRLVRPAAADRLRWHQEQGHRVVIASASLELFLEPWARSAGIDDVVATRLEVRGGLLTGRLDGGNCYGQAKLDRVRDLLGGLDGTEIYAYGDSRGDREVLAAAGHAFYRPFR
jgi:HAD superfamily hydrolase (TIGR01490 family)